MPQPADDIEQELRDVIGANTGRLPLYGQHPRDLDQPTRELLPPNYPVQQPVLIEQPMVSAEDLGRITAEAIRQAHGGIITALEGLGKDMVARVEQLDQLKAQCQQQLDDIKELIAHYNDAGKEMSLRVENTGNDLNDARDTIEALREKIKSG